MSEWTLIEILRRELTRGTRAGIVLDIGDDAAVLRPRRGDTVLSVDASVEGVHFRRAWAPWDVIAARAFEAALSDLAAMGSEPVAALVAFALPRATRERDVRDMARGLARAARRHACPVVGGNLTRASEVSITTTVLGTSRGHLTRGRARPGDDVLVTGRLGGAALGLACLERGGVRGAAPFVRRFLEPQARVDAGRALSRVARACIDVSDGLVSDLEHVAAASGVAIEIELARVPRQGGLDALAARLGLDGDALVLAGGEDYELAFTTKPGARLPIRATRIGRVIRGEGVAVLGSAKVPRGHDHFAARGRQR
jgi:thiamine-monophosphate kinase